MFGPLPKPAWFGARLAARLRDRGPLHRRDPRQRADVVGDGALPDYAPGERYWGISPLADQSTAGVVMMIEGAFLALGVLAWVFFEVAREGPRSSSACSTSPRSAASSSTSARAQRAVAAGQGGRLEERLAAASADSQRRSRTRRSAPHRFSTCSSSSSARPASAPRSPPRGCWRPTSAPRRSSGRTRSASSSSPSRSATGSAAAIADRHPAPARPLPARARRRGPDRRGPVRGAALPRLLGRRPRRRSRSAASSARSFGVLVLVAVPVMLLGAASPWAVRLAVADVEHSGEVVGPPLRDLDRRLAARDDGSRRCS